MLIVVKSYVERLVSRDNEIDVYVNGELYLEKRTSPIMKWKKS